MHIKHYSLYLLFLVVHIGCSQNNISDNEIFDNQAKFMTFNIWQEGTSVSNGLIKIRDVIIETNPDVVCFTEVRNYKKEDWTDKIIKELQDKGYPYYRGYIGGDVSLISKFPITSSSLIYNGEGSIVKFDVNFEEHTVVVACAHLDYTKYACYLPRGYNGGTPNWNMINDGYGNPTPVTDVKKILAYNLESERDEQITSFLKSIKNETQPVILLGDFNEPSHLDWTKNTSTLFDHNGVIINWQSTYSLFKNGFTDAFRKFFPDEKSNPGITWPSLAHGKKSTSWTPKSDERDRIDYIFYKEKGIETLYATLVGPKESYAFGELTDSSVSNENFVADKLEWPSDHKALMVILKFPF
jgi:endonuclease/exonuclease/phosphatase family metal-dependent hydrolase